MDAINELPLFWRIAVYLFGIILAGGGIAGFVSLLRVRPQNKKDCAEAELTLGKGWKDLLIETRTEMRETKEEVANMKQEQQRQADTIEKQEKKIERYAARIVYLMGGIEMLMRQFVDADIEPCWTPDDWKLEDEQSRLS